MIALPKGRGTAGLHLVLKSEGGRLQVVDAVRVPRVPRVLLRPPVLREEHALTSPTPQAELVLAQLSRDGAMLGSFGWPAESQVFFDLQIGEVRGGLRGRTRELEALPRILRVPLPEGTDFLFFYSVSTTPGERDGAGARFAREPLCLYYLGPPDLVPPHAPPLPIPGHVPPQPLPWRLDSPRPRTERLRRR